MSRPILCVGVMDGISAPTIDRFLTGRAMRVRLRLMRLMSGRWCLWVLLCLYAGTWSLQGQVAKVQVARDVDQQGKADDDAMRFEVASIRPDRGHFVHQVLRFPPMTGSEIRTAGFMLTFRWPRISSLRISSGSQESRGE